MKKCECFVGFGSQPLCRVPPACLSTSKSRSVVRYPNDVESANIGGHVSCQISPMVAWAPRREGLGLGSVFVFETRPSGLLPMIFYGAQ